MQNLQIALSKAEAQLAQKQEMVNKEKAQTKAKAKAEERANDVMGPGDRVKHSEVEVHLMQNKEMVNKDKMQAKTNAGQCHAPRQSSEDHLGQSLEVEYFHKAHAKN